MSVKASIERALRLAVLSLLLCLSACLQTRESQKEVEEKQQLKKQLGTLQMTSADSNARFQDVEEENRRLGGRIEALEAKLLAAAQRTDKINATQDTKAKENNDVYKEEFTKLNTEIARLKEQLTALSEEQRRAAEARAAESSRKSAEGAKNPFAAGEEKFEKKQWKEAILDYEKYRSANAKGKNFAAATYKIGVCFQELGLAQEAKDFYSEVIAKFPKSKEAEKASARLKKLDKKK